LVNTLENTLSGERLYVNEELQDTHSDIAFRSIMTGHIITGEHIKVSLGGAFKVYCHIFVDDKLALSK